MTYACSGVGRRKAERAVRKASGRGLERTNRASGRRGGRQPSYGQVYPKAQRNSHLACPPAPPRDQVLPSLCSGQTSILTTPKVPVLTYTSFDTNLAGARPDWTTVVQERARVLQACILVCLISLINILYRTRTCDAELCSRKVYH